MRHLLTFAILAVAFAMTSTADPVSIPHEFRPGTPARAADVNANFRILADASNAQDERVTNLESSTAETRQRLDVVASQNAAQDGRIESLEAFASSTLLKPVNDQLVCVVFYSWVLDGTAFSCVQASSPSTVVTRNFPQILTEGWILISSGGSGGGGERLVLVFHK